MKKSMFIALIAISSLAIVPWLSYGQLGGGMGGMGGGGLGGSRASGLSGGGVRGLGGGMGGGAAMEGSGMGGQDGGSGGMGGMGGGGMGGMSGGMGGTVAYEAWQRPAGPEPTWLENGRKSTAATEAMREMLNQELEREIKVENLLQLPEAIAQILPIEFNTRAIEDNAMELASMKGANQSKGTLREFLRRSLEPNQLTYIVHESYVEITTVEIAKISPVVRYYNLSFVLPDNQLRASVIQAIESSVNPDTWQNAGGDSSIFPIGPLLVVSTTEANHLEVEQLLSQLSEQLGTGNGRQPGAAPIGLKN